MEVGRGPRRRRYERPRRYAIRDVPRRSLTGRRTSRGWSGWRSRPSCATMPSCSARPRCCASREGPTASSPAWPAGGRTVGASSRPSSAPRSALLTLAGGLGAVLYGVRRDRLHRLRRAVDTAPTRRARPLATGAGNRLRDRSRARRLPDDRPVARRRDHDPGRGDRRRDLRRVVVGQRRPADRRRRGRRARFRSSPGWSSSSPAWRRSPAAPAGSATSGRPAAAIAVVVGGLAIFAAPAARPAAAPARRRAGGAHPGGGAGDPRRPPARLGAAVARADAAHDRPAPDDDDRPASGA